MLGVPFILADECKVSSGAIKNRCEMVARTKLVLVGMLWLLVCAGADAKEKLTNDPTKIETKLGLGYQDDWSFSGSLAFDPVRKINLSVKADGNEWRGGGSWLFDIGIVNLNFGRTEFDNGNTQDSYSVGTFLPLSIFGFAPGGVQIFPMFGYAYSNGETICDTRPEDSECYGFISPEDGFLIYIPTENHSGYIGALALKPLSDEWTLLTVLNYTQGSDDFNSAFGALGAGYTLNKRHSMSLMAFSVDNTYGDKSGIGASYKYAF
ncbi:hypothetical protein A3742_03460 [Oleiphilus sp. HI0071]|nr:hypothetical protein A3737_14220 [Oleiphilus sp. HI0065]KZY89397.1 hypothetical protein A3742_03460 [Oleiphilus sp. HI0071]KZZ17921.1 hypothetical protein A3751_09925 [Oleiphilus sp. HI0080]KZZ80913.1 hypothetical protein A3767_09285 [Oleiphilus sp. HI0133]